MTDLASISARRNNHPNHIQHCAVTMTAPCPDCDQPAERVGSRVECGGSTAWTVHCRCKEDR